ncbi:MAG: hypothetical protein ABJC39_06285 [Chloroflexota bacterium]
MTAPAVQAGPPTSAFSGHWQAIDPIDGSNLDAYISGGTNAQIVYTDDSGVETCAGSSSKVFTSFLTGAIDGDQLNSTMRVAKCGNVNLHFSGFTITWTLDDHGNADPSDDTLTNDFGEIYSRVS